MLEIWLRSKRFEKFAVSACNDTDMEAVKLTEITLDDAVLTDELMLVQHKDSCDTSWLSKQGFNSACGA